MIHVRGRVPCRCRVKATQTLKEHIGWTGIGDQQIGIDIERLLCRLRRDRNNSSAVAMRSEDAEKLPVEP